MSGDNLQQRDLDIPEGVQQWAVKMIKRLEHLTYQEKLGDMRLFILEKKRLKEVLSMYTNS